MRIAGAIVGVGLFAAIEIGFGNRTESHAAAVTALMIAFWMTEAIPIHWTALIPLFTFPALAVFQSRQLAQESDLLQFFLRANKGFAYQTARTIDGYLDSNTFLFMGGMCLAAAMEAWNLHRRIALSIMRAIGGGPQRLVLGFLLATAGVSLWISNTATAVMMMPIGLAVIRRLEEEEGRRLPHFGFAIMLAVAYGANVGGIGTKIGTAPNVIFCGFAERVGRPIDFIQYLQIGAPFVLLFLPIVWLLLTRLVRPDNLGAGRGREAVREELAKLGPMSGWEKFVAATFGAAAALWIGGQPLSGLLLLRGPQMDALTAMAAAGVLAAGGALRWRDIRRVPWSVLLLLGGSFAMAEGVSGSGLTRVLSGAVEGVRTWPLLPMFLTVAVSTVALSAAASNTATTTLMMTILQPLGVPVMATSAISASCDFMLPAGTPPNAIIFGSGYVTVPRMARVGAVLDLAAAVLAGLWGYLGVRALLG